MEIYTDVFPLEYTLCKNCVHRFSRVMVPLDYESLGIDLKDFDLEDGEDLMMEQHICLVTQEDLDGIIKKCSHFKEDNDVSFFCKNPY